MTLAEQISADMKSAMKAKNNATLSTLRMLASALKNKQIELLHELSEQEVLAVIRSQVKQLRDSTESFAQGGRQDLVDGVLGEIKVLEAYLPAELSDDQLVEVVKKTIVEVGAASKADMGKVMGGAMKAVAGQADGGRVKAIVEQLLGVLVLVAIGLVVMPASVSARSQFGVETAQVMDWAEFALRIFRVLILWSGIFSITSIMKGGFQYMTASMRDSEHDEALAKMTSGFVGTIVVAGLFSIATVFLNQII